MSGSSLRTAAAGLLAALTLTLAACGAPAAAPSVAPSAASSSSAVMPTMSAGTTAEAMAMTDTATQAAWKKLPLTDSQGRTFTIGDLAGKPVYIEFFATWCPGCRAQLMNTNAAAQQVGSKAVFLALSVETDLATSDMVTYKSENKFNAVTFAVMSPAMLAAVVACFGNNAANPPSTPHVVISGHGAVANLHTGSEDPTSIVASLGSM